MNPVCYLSLLWGVVSVCLPSAALAHPHAWIDYRTKIVMDDMGKMTALKEHWIFDEYYTEFAIKDFDPNKNGKLDHEELMALGEDNLKNLKDFGYYTELKSDGKKIAPKPPSEINSYLVNGHIALDFTLLLSEPVDPAKHKITYRIYDPSYYVSMLHDKKEAIAFEGKKAASCQHELTTPKPDIMKINFAASIDKNGQAPDELGSFFAQKVTITCK